VGARIGGLEDKAISRWKVCWKYTASAWNTCLEHVKIVGKCIRSEWKCVGSAPEVLVEAVLEAVGGVQNCVRTPVQRLAKTF